MAVTIRNHTNKFVVILSVPFVVYIGLYYVTLQNHTMETFRRSVFTVSKIENRFVEYQAKENIFKSESSLLYMAQMTSMKANSTEANSTKVTAGFERFKHIEQQLYPADDVNLNWTQYESSSLAVFVLSAMVANKTIRGYEHVLKLNAWEAHKHRDVDLRCCYLWRQGHNISTQLLSHKLYYRNIKFGLRAVSYQCLLHGNPTSLFGVAMEFKPKMCPRVKSKYVKVTRPLKQKPESFAICGKILYGDADAKLLIEWIEYYKELKVDKIVVFTYKLNIKAYNVLRYYEQTGFIEVKQYDFPWKERAVGNMRRDVGTKNPLAWQDEQVAVFDCYERLQGYDYVAIVDLDEFIVPKARQNLKDLMKYLTDKYQLAAGFTFKSFLFIKSWGKIVENGGSDVTQYLNRTKALYTRPKHVYLPSRVNESVWTHGFTPQKGFKKIILPDKLAIVHHYRNCYADIKRTCKNIKRVRDASILKITKLTHHRTKPLMKRFG